jgi:hypothetical protein
MIGMLNHRSTFSENLNCTSRKSTAGRLKASRRRQLRRRPPAKPAAARTKVPVGCSIGIALKKLTGASGSGLGAR